MTHAHAISKHHIGIRRVGQYFIPTDTPHFIFIDNILIREGGNCIGRDNRGGNFSHTLIYDKNRKIFKRTFVKSVTRLFCFIPNYHSRIKHITLGALP